MAAKKVRVDYDELAQIARGFDFQAEITRQILNQLHKHMDVLLDGDWVGQGATPFYREMIEHDLPAMDRLAKALAEGGRVTRQISSIMKQAEEESAALFRLDEADSAQALSGPAQAVFAEGSDSHARASAGAGHGGKAREDSRTHKDWAPLEGGLIPGTNNFGPPVGDSSSPRSTPRPICLYSVGITCHTLNALRTRSEC